jgi:hypothetical protein
MYKIIGSDQKIYGPASPAQIRQWQAEGRVHGGTLLQAEGSAEWKTLLSIPEFAVPPVVTMPAAPPQRRNGMAVAGLVFGITSNVCCCFGFIGAVLGIIFSLIALNQCETQPNSGSKGMAVAGLVLSIVGLTWHCFLPLTFLGGFPGAWNVHHHWHRW